MQIKQSDMIEFNPNFNKNTALKTAGVNVLFRFGMQTAKPFKIKEDEDFSLTGTADLESRPWLTSLEIQLSKGQSFIFNEVVMSVSQERNIVTTPLQGRDGTIKEFISNGDYNISIDAGVMAGTNETENNDDETSFLIPNDEYPEAELKKLGEILLAKRAIAVQSDFLDIFNIKSVVIKSFIITQETHSNRQSIQIQMLSDMPYEIKQIKDDYVKVK